MFDIMLKALVVSEVCYKTKCNDGEVDMPHLTCTLLQNDTIYLNPCPSGYTCVTGFEQSQCLPDIEIINGLAYPGEPCKKKTQKCKYGKCKYGYCQGAELNSPCSLNTQCSPGLYCKSGICKTLISAGDKGCERDYDCENSAGCLEGVCVNYFSLNVGDPVSVCANHFSIFCMTATCWQYTCINAINSHGKLPKPCETYEDCYSVSTNGMVFYSDCICGNNPEGQKYCSLFSGDNYYSLYISSFSNWLSSEVSVLCNTERRFSEQCIKKFWDKPNYQEFMLYLYKTIWYPILQKNDKCIEEIFTYQYWDLIDDITWGMFLVLPSIVVYLV